MEITLIIVFVLTALLLNLVIVLQPGKGSGMGALGGGGGSLGGGGASSVFGARGAVPFLSKLTAWLAALFMALSLGLARISLDKSSISVSALKPPVTETSGAGAGDDAEESKAAEGDKESEEAKPAAADQGAEGEGAKPAAADKAAEGDDTKPAAADKAAGADKAEGADKAADTPAKKEGAPAEGAKKVEGGE